MKLNRIISVIFLSSLLSANHLAIAHGEENPGPHGGLIRMPGAFHTEVISEKTGFKIFLVDINFEHPMTKDSSVKASIKSNGKTTELKCETRQEDFFCEAPKDLMEAKGTLEILPTRHKAQGALVTYPLPLEIEKVNKK